jgi:hypothetical protein
MLRLGPEKGCAALKRREMLQMQTRRVVSAEGYRVGWLRWCAADAG